MLRAERQSARMSKITNDNSVCHMMLYRYAHMATVGVKGLNKEAEDGIVCTVNGVRTYNACCGLHQMTIVMIIYLKVTYFDIVDTILCKY